MRINLNIVCFMAFATISTGSPAAVIHRSISSTLSSKSISSEPYMRNPQFQRVISCLFERYPNDVDEAVMTSETVGFGHVKQVRMTECVTKEEMKALEPDEGQQAVQILTSLMEEKRRRLAACVVKQNPAAVKKETLNAAFDPAFQAGTKGFGKKTMQAGYKCDPRYFELMVTPSKRGLFFSALAAAVNDA